MAIMYQLKEKMELATPSSSAEEGVATVKLYSPTELEQEGLVDPEISESLRLLAHVGGLFAEILTHSIVGIISVPDTQGEFSTRIMLHYYLNSTQLIIVGPDTVAEKLIESTPELKILKNMTPAQVLLELLKTLVKNDTTTLSDFENRFIVIEEDIVEHENRHTARDMPKIRRDLLKFDRFYQQLTDMVITLGKDENHILTRDDRRLFRLFSEQTKRLYQRSQYLKEYSLQLRELFQTQIDLQQNKIIQWFTVVTTIFVPLTLITSWYGMNFTYMPELDWPYSYAVVIAVCLALVIVELIFFKRRKWL